MAGNGLKWNGLITDLGILKVWDLKTGGLDIGEFPIGWGKTGSPGLVFFVFCLKEN